MELHGIFHGVLRCAISTCAEPVAVAGDYAVDVDVDETGDTYYLDVYKLRYATPALRIVAPPAKTPADVVKAIEAAAYTIWADPNSAANRLRVAIDELLTAYGMRRYVVSNHKRSRLSTHQRIQEFKKWETSAAEALEAVKWIGNAGSHESALSATDVLEGAELLAYALRLLYDTSEEELRRRVRAINKRRGVQRKRR